eukprot:11990821-Alexandrium_andersonii.AAC.1
MATGGRPFVDGQRSSCASSPAPTRTSRTRTSAERRASQRWARHSAERLLCKLRSLGVLASPVAARLAAAAPAVAALASGTQPPPIARLRRNVALHSSADIDFVRASAGTLRAAQRGARLQPAPSAPERAQNRQVSFAPPHAAIEDSTDPSAVSYTHLTLPTICSV